MRRKAIRVHADTEKIMEKAMIYYIKLERRLINKTTFLDLLLKGDFAAQKAHELAIKEKKQ